MRVFSLRTKLEVVGLAILLVSISIASVFAVTRTITSSSDTFDTYIRNSKGNYWAATGANIQTAIWDLNSTNGGTVWLPAGTIPFSGYIDLKNNTHLQGAGMYQTILKNVGNIYWGSTVASINKHDIVISDLTINGNNSYGGGGMTQDSYGILVIQTRNITISNVKVIYTTSVALCFGTVDDYHTVTYDYGAKNVVVNNYVGIGAHKTGEYQHGLTMNYLFDGVFSNILLSNCGGGGMDLADSNNITFSSININHIDLTNLGHGIKLIRCENLTFSSMFISNVSNNGIKFQTGNKYISFTGLIIQDTTNCAIQDTATSEGMSYISFTNFYFETDTISANVIALDAKSNNVTFSNGVCKDGNNNGIYVPGKDITINNVKIINPYYHGIYCITGASRIYIRNCVFDGSARGNAGVYLSATVSRVYVTTCDFYNWADYGFAAVDGTNTANNLTVLGSSFLSCGKAIEVDSGVTNFLFNDNICIEGTAANGDLIDINAATSATRRVNDSICTIVTS